MKTDTDTMEHANAVQAGIWRHEAEVESQKLSGELDRELSDEALMVLCQKGRQDALEEIYRRYYRPVLLFILRLIQNREMAEDLVQETFIRVYNNRKSWQPRSKFTSWLYRIARNICIDEKRRYWNRLVHTDSQFRDYSENGNFTILDRIEDGAGDARDHFALKLDEEAIKQAINQLSPEQREVIILNKYQGMSYQEIAEIVGATPESIKQRAYRAHLKLRQILQPLLEEYA
ncbi:MAG: RNA polymerase sigma factor [Candidatus Hinthialibacter sp.]